MKARTWLAGAIMTVSLVVGSSSAFATPTCERIASTCIGSSAVSAAACDANYRLCVQRRKNAERRARMSPRERYIEDCAEEVFNSTNHRNLGEDFVERMTSLGERYCGLRTGSERSQFRAAIRSNIQSHRAMQKFERDWCKFWRGMKRSGAGQYIAVPRECR